MFVALLNASDEPKQIDNQDMLYNILNLIYNAARAFLYLIQNCKIPFAELRVKMINIMDNFKDLYKKIFEYVP